MAATGKVLGTVTSVVGEAKATAADGTVRVLQVGDIVHSDEVITTSAAGAINIALASGKTLDCGANTDLSLHESILGVATAASTAPATAGAPAAPGSVEAIQQAIASGQDPSQIAPATAAGGAPGAGGAGDGGGGTPVILEQANTSSIVTSGFPTEGDTITFPTPEFELLPEEEQPPTVSVSVQVQVQVEVEVDVSIEAGPEVLSGPATGGVFAVSASGDAVSLLEGTMEGTMEIPFVITLSQVFDTDVQVTYQIVPASADNPTDFFDGDLIQTITIPAGESSFIVPIQIVRDHFVEGNESFSIVLIDAVNATINPAQSSAMVTIFNDDANPVANDDTNWAQEDSSVVASGNVLQSAPHAGAPSGSFADAADTDFEPLTVTNPGTYAGSFGTLVLASDGSYTYTLNNASAAVQTLDSGETLSDSFGYSATDGFNTPDSATLTVTIFGSNDTPEITVRTSSEIFASGAEASVNEAALALGSNPSSNGEFATGSFQVSDTDGVEDIASVTINGQTVAIGSLVGATFDGSAGTMTVTSYSGGIANFTYELTQAVTDGAGAETDVFTLTASDGTSSSAPATVTISIVDDVPTAVNDSNSMTEDSASVSGNVRDNDTQGADRIATVGAGSLQGEFGTLALGSDGSYTYTRTANLQGMDDGEAVADVFTYTLTDADGDPSLAQLTITLNGANDAPVAIDDTNSMTEEQVSVSGNVLANDTDVDGETLTVVADPITLNHAMGTLVIQDNGSYTFTLNEAGLAAAQALDDGENFVAQFSDAYQNTDGDANSNLADVTITVTGLNDAPVAINDTNSMTEDQASVSGNVLANDTDIDDEPLTVVGTPITLEDEMGTLVIDQANGSYTFTLSQAGVAAAQALDDGENFVVSFGDAYQNTDGDADSNFADVTITVTGLNDAMNADDDTDSFTEEQVAITVAGNTNVLNNDDEIDSSDLPLTVQDTATQDVFLLDSEGNLTSTVAGTITFAADGTYSLSLNDATKAAAQALDQGQTLQVGVVYTAQNAETPTPETDDAVLRITVTGLTDATFGITVTSESPVNDTPTQLASVKEEDTVDDSGTFTISLSGDTLAEGQTASVTVTMSGSAQDADFTAAVIQSIATAATGAGIAISDQTATAITLTWSAGDPTNLPVVLTAFDDTVSDSPETLTLSLSAPVVTGGSATLVSGQEGASLTIQDFEARILNGVMITNTNVTNQFVTMSFVENVNPLHSAAKIYDLSLQGQQGTVIQDVGFNIDPAKQYQVTLEASSGTKAIVTDFFLEGVTIQDSGNYQLEINNNAAGPDRTALTTRITPNDPSPTVADQVKTDSTDGTAVNQTLADDGSATTLNYLFGADGADTLNGGDGSEVLNGGGGVDALNGNGGNDILVFDNANNDAISGGAGTDLLRVDTGALALSLLGSANNSNTLNSANNVVVNISGKNITGIEGVLITEEAGQSTLEVDPNDDVGTTLVLNADDVLLYTDNVDNQLYIMGSPGDKVQLSPTDGWSTGVQQPADLQGQAFVLFTATNGAKLLVETDVQVTGI